MSVSTAQQRQIIHTFSNMAVLRKMQARDLIHIEIWNGNRTLNHEHKRQIVESLKIGVHGLDLNPFHIIRYPIEDPDTGEQLFKTYIIDGQHRASILKDAYTVNTEALYFDVIVIEHSCSSEEDAIRYFKILNTTHAVEWKDDPKLLANKYVAGIEKEFNKGKTKFVRQHGCHRPYLSLEKLRDAIIKYKIHEKGRKLADFVSFARTKNLETCEYFKALGENEKLIERSVAMGFCLALDETFKWMEEFS